MKWTPLTRSWNLFTVATLTSHGRPARDAAMVNAKALERWENEGGMIPQLRGSAGSNRAEASIEN